MTIGTSIFIGAVGAILRFAVADQVDGVDLAMIGTILMVAAVIGVIVGLIQLSTARRVVHEDRRVERL